MHKSSADQVKIIDGSSFFISDGRGDVNGKATDGLFFKDTRFLSVNKLRINGESPTLLSNKEVDYFSTRFFMTMPFSTSYEAHPLSIIRSRLIGRGAYEQLLLSNYSDVVTELMVALEYGSDFAGLFEAKSKSMAINRRVTSEHDAHSITFKYSEANISRETIIRFSQTPMVADRTAYFTVKLHPGHSWKLDIWISLLLDGHKIEPKYSQDTFGKIRPQMEASTRDWLDSLPELSADMDFLLHTYNRTKIDLASLRFRPDPEEHPVLAAGLPWYMALFGRDNLIASYQTCFIAPQLAQAALATLAKLQGTKTIDFQDEQPGKILHELRFDEQTLKGDLPYSPYYGAADTTPLFLILLNEVYMWTADDELVRSLAQPAKSALNWIDQYGDADSDGYVEFQTKSNKGIKNQCWKDSWNSISFQNGKLAEPPLAVAEIQGYVYDAKIRTAYLAETIWHDPGLADRLRAQAAKLKESFNRDFWIDRRGGYFALALDKDKKQVDSLTSNIGQLLWSGIVEKDKADKIVKQLFAGELYSGWGIRTLSTADRAYNPITYHNGTIWPHDNSLIAAGLARYGYHNQANKIMCDMIEAAQYFDYRLPEVFAGYDKSHVDFPVEYPTACSPQAWAAGAPVLFLRNALGLTADPQKKTVQMDPRLPEKITQLDLRNLRLFGKVFHIHIDPKQQYIECDGKMDGAI